MSFPFFSWEPHQTDRVSTGDREFLSLREDLSDLQITPRRTVVDQYSIFGGRSRENLRAWMDVRIVLDRFRDRALYRQLAGLVNHLERGGNVAFGLDPAKIFFTTTRTITKQGVQLIRVNENFHKSLHTSAPTFLSEFDEFVIESTPPKVGREYHQVLSHNYTTGTTDGKIQIKADTMNGETVTRHTVDHYPTDSIVRHSDYFPTLILDQAYVGTAILSHDHRINYTFDITLTYVIPFTRKSPDIQYDDAISAADANGGDKPDYDNAATEAPMG